MIKFGIVGTGAAAHQHAAAFLDLKDQASLIACYDRDSQKSLDFAEKWNLVPVNGIREFSRLDAICICTPPPTHTSIAIAVMNMGLHVLTEKPLATNLKDADCLIDSSNRNKVVLSVVSQRRWLPAANRAKKAIEKGFLGDRIILGDSYCEDWKGPEAFKRAPWRRTWEGAGGGVLMNQCPHNLDLLLWYMGKPVEVFGYFRNLTHSGDMEMEDNAVAVIKFESGGLATLRASISTYPPRRFNGVSLLGENGRTISVDIWGYSEGYNDIWTAPFVEMEEEKYENLHTYQLEDFISSIKNGRPPSVTAKDGRRVVEVIEKIYSNGR